MTTSDVPETRTLSWTAWETAAVLGHMTVAIVKMLVSDAMVSCYSTFVHRRDLLLDFDEKVILWCAL